MRKKKKAGFTLIELLAVIIILAIIALITTPLILNIIREVKEKAFIKSAYAIKSSVNNYIIFNQEEEQKVFTFPNSYDGLKFTGTIPDSGVIVVNNDKNISLALWSDELKKCAFKSFLSSEIDYSKEITTKEQCIIETNDGDITLLEQMINETNSGLYKNVFDNGWGDEIDLGYYYHGLNPNNFINFNGDVYRIVAANSLGIKIIRPSSETINFNSLLSSNNNFISLFLSNPLLKVVNKNVCLDWTSILNTNFVTLNKFAFWDSTYTYNYDSNCDRFNDPEYKTFTAFDYIFSSSDTTSCHNGEENYILDIINNCKASNWLAAYSGDFWLDNIRYESGTSNPLPLYLNSSKQPILDSYESEHKYFQTIYINLNAKYVSGDGSISKPYVYK